MAGERVALAGVARVCSPDRRSLRRAVVALVPDRLELLSVTWACIEQLGERVLKRLDLLLLDLRGSQPCPAGGGAVRSFSSPSARDGKCYRTRKSCRASIHSRHSGGEDSLSPRSAPTGPPQPNLLRQARSPSLSSVPARS